MISDIERKLAYQLQPLLSVEMDTLNGKEFEKYCADILENIGFVNVSVTPGSGDYGIDILAEKEKLIFGFQCKCYSSSIGVKAVQEVSSGSIYYNCDRAVVITNNYFTPAAINMAKRIGVILWDRNELENLLNTLLYITLDKINDDKSLKQIKEEQERREQEKTLKFQQLMNQQLKREAIQQQQEQKRKLIEVEKKKQETRKVLLRCCGVLGIAFLIITIFVLLEGKIHDKQYREWLYVQLNDSAEKFGFTIRDIKIEKEECYECNIDSYDFDSLKPEQMYLFYDGFIQKVEKSNDEAYIKTVMCNGNIYTFTDSLVMEADEIIYDQDKIDMEKREEELRREYGEEYPCLGMREEALPYTILGEPDRITKCRDFDILEPRAQSKEYEWGEPFKPGYYSVTVWYKKHLSNRVDDYVEYPPDNGYVFSIYYYDEYGNSHNIDMLD